jgi:hypothetical protein
MSPAVEGSKTIAFSISIFDKESLPVLNNSKPLYLKSAALYLKFGPAAVKKSLIAFKPFVKAAVSVLFQFSA